VPDRQEMQIHRMRNRDKGAQRSHMFKARTLKRSMLATFGALLAALAAVATAGAVWKAPTYLTPEFIPADIAAEVAMDADGDSYFSYALSDGRVQAKKYTAAGTPAWTKTLTPRPTNPEQEISGELPAHGVNPAGDSAYAWLTSNQAGTRSILQARTLSRTGVLGQVKTLADIGQSQGEHDQLAVDVDADGDAIIAWTQEALVAERGVVTARALSKTGVLGAAQTISSSDSGSLAEFVSVGMRPNGDALFVWQYSRTNLEGQIQMRTRLAAGNLTPIRNVSRLESTFPALDMAPDGDAVVAWLYADPFAGGQTVEVRRISAAGTLGAIKGLSPRGGEAHDVDVALNDAGAIAAIWTIKNPISGKDQLKGRTVSPTDALGKSHDLVSNALESPTEPMVGISSAARVVFAWQFHATNDRVQSKTLTSTGTLSATKTVGSALAMGLESDLAVAPSGQAAVTWADQDVKRLAAAFGP
jgi:hypothetical protein